MKFCFTVLFTAFLFLFVNLSTAPAQVDSIIGQFTNSPAESYAGGVSGNGRLVVFESTGNLATENPRNADGNREIFIFDYAQRRIFQITDTKSVLIDRTKAATFDNVRVEIVNVRPVISNNGRWIAFGSNATTSTPNSVNSTNPGSFNGNDYTVSSGTPPTDSNPLTMDGNTEMWLYEVPAVAPVDLSAGAEIPVTNLSAGIFTRVTNTLPTRQPVSGSSSLLPVIANDNRDASISDDGNFIAFVSNRDLKPCEGTPTATCGNSSDFDNPEIYTYVRALNIISQVTATPPGPVTAPINNLNPTISGTTTSSGTMRVAFSSNAENPIRGMTGGSNSDGNVEIYFSDLAANGEPTGTRRQLTQTTPTNVGDVVNNWNYGRRMSRDGRYIAFDSYADLESSSAPIQTSFALYVYDTTAAMNAFRRIGPRSDADSAATGGDVAHYPGFTDNDVNGTPSTLVLETRLNIKADGTIPATAADGLNPAPERPAQIYSYPLTVPPATATFTRLTKLPVPIQVLASIQPITTDSRSRMVFNLALTEVGTGNFDEPFPLSEGYYLLIPTVDSESTTTTLNYFTGASRIPVSPSPVPTPTPGTTPTPSPSPTPQTPPAVQGVSPGMLAIVTLTPAHPQPAVELTAVGSLQRSFTLPIELGGVSLSVNGAAAGLKMVSGGQITFVVPPGLTPSETPYPIVINNNGVVIRSSMTVVVARPDVFTFNPVPGPGGRAMAFNATNRVLTREPFAVRTLRFRGGVLVPTVLRLYLTGVQGAAAANFSIRIGSVTIPSPEAPPAQILTGAVLVEPGVYTVDFTLPPALEGAGDQPIVVSITAGTVTYTSRLDDTAPRVRIL